MTLFRRYLQSTKTERGGDTDLVGLGHLKAQDRCDWQANDRCIQDDIGNLDSDEDIEIRDAVSFKGGVPGLLDRHALEGRHKAYQNPPDQRQGSKDDQPGFEPRIWEHSAVEAQDRKLDEGDGHSVQLEGHECDLLPVSVKQRNKSAVQP